MYGGIVSSSRHGSGDSAGNFAVRFLAPARAVVPPVRIRREPVGSVTEQGWSVGLDPGTAARQSRDVAPADNKY